MQYELPENSTYREEFKKIREESIANARALRDDTYEILKKESHFANFVFDLQKFTRYIVSKSSTYGLIPVIRERIKLNCNQSPINTPFTCKPKEDTKSGIALLTACTFFGDLPSIKFCLKQGANVNFTYTFYLVDQEFKMNALDFSLILPKGLYKRYRKEKYKNLPNIISLLLSEYKIDSFVTYSSYRDRYDPASFFIYLCERNEEKNLAGALKSWGQYQLDSKEAAILIDYLNSRTELNSAHLEAIRFLEGHPKAGKLEGIELLKNKALETKGSISVNNSCN